MYVYTYSAPAAPSSSLSSSAGTARGWTEKVVFPKLLRRAPSLNPFPDFTSDRGVVKCVFPSIVADKDFSATVLH